MNRFVTRLSVLAILSLSQFALADYLEFNVAQVEYLGPSKRLLIMPAPNASVPTPVVKYAQETAACSGTSANSIEAIKIWQSLATAALLSGKKIGVYYSVCSSEQIIFDVILKS